MFCFQECPSNTYGYNCNQTCNCPNAISCDSKVGCICNKGYTDSNCETILDPCSSTSEPFFVKFFIEKNIILAFLFS